MDFKKEHPVQSTQTLSEKNMFVKKKIEQLTNEEIVIISNYIANDYVPHEEPARSAILKLHRIAEKYR